MEKLKKPKKNVTINIKNLAPLVMNILLGSPASQTLKFPESLARSFRSHQDFLEYAIKKCDVLTNSRTFKRVLKELEIPEKSFQVFHSTPLYYFRICVDDWLAWFSIGWFPINQKDEQSNIKRRVYDILKCLNGLGVISVGPKYIIAFNLESHIKMLQMRQTNHHESQIAIKKFNEIMSYQEALVHSSFPFEFWLFGLLVVGEKKEKEKKVEEKKNQLAEMKVFYGKMLALIKRNKEQHLEKNDPKRFDCPLVFLKINNYEVQSNETNGTRDLWSQNAENVLPIVSKDPVSGDISVQNKGPIRIFYEADVINQLSLKSIEMEEEVDQREADQFSQIKKKRELEEQNQNQIEKNSLLAFQSTLGFYKKDENASLMEACGEEQPSKKEFIGKRQKGASNGFQKNKKVPEFFASLRDQESSMKKEEIYLEEAGMSDILIE